MIHIVIAAITMAFGVALLLVGAIGLFNPGYLSDIGMSQGTDIVLKAAGMGIALVFGLLAYAANGQDAARAGIAALFGFMMAWYASKELFESGELHRPKYPANEPRKAA